MSEQAINQLFVEAELADAVFWGLFDTAEDRLGIGNWDGLDAPDFPEWEIEQPAPLEWNLI